MSENTEQYQEINQRENHLDRPLAKKRHRDEIEGETITQDTFKKTLLNANVDEDVADSNKVTFLRLGITKYL